MYICIYTLFEQERGDQPLRVPRPAGGHQLAGGHLIVIG